MINWPFTTGLLGIAVAVTACSASLSTDPELSSADAHVRSLAMRGDKTAQLELGIRYEEGVGMPRDYRRAAQLYKMASRPSTGQTFIYVPATGKSRAGVIPFRTGTREPGLRSAKIRLARLYRLGLGVAKNDKRAAEIERQIVEEGSSLIGRK